MSKEVDQSKSVLLPSPLKWIWRNPFKTIAMFACVLFAFWHFEDWRGKRDLVEQKKLWVAEFGEITIDSIRVEEVANAENFFAAPVFDAMASAREPHDLPNAKFLKLSIPLVVSLPIAIERAAESFGFEPLDLEPAAHELELTGQVRPADLSSAEWLHGMMPKDSTIDGLRDALSRPKTQRIPFTFDCWKVGIEVGDPSQIPFPTVGSITPLSKELTTRSSVAARAGNGKSAAELCEVNLRLAEGFSKSKQLVGTLVAIAVAKIGLPAIPEALQSRCWTDAELASIQNHLRQIDLEASLLASLKAEVIQIHVFDLDEIRDWHRQHDFGTSGLWDGAMAWFCRSGPDGWTDANLATFLRYWQALLVPDTKEDDLLALDDRMRTGMSFVRDELKRPASARTVASRLAMPTMGNITASAMTFQSRQRQLLIAIAVERYRLKHGTVPESAAVLVPEFLEEIPDDPFVKGQKFDLVPAASGERYRIGADSRDRILAIPNTL